MSRFSEQFFTIYKWFSLLCLQLGTDFKNRRRFFSKISPEQKASLKWGRGSNRARR